MSRWPLLAATKKYAGIGFREKKYFSKGPATLPAFDFHYGVVGRIFTEGEENLARVSREKKRNWEIAGKRNTGLKSGDEAACHHRRGRAQVAGESAAPHVPVWACGGIGELEVEVKNWSAECSAGAGATYNESSPGRSNQLWPICSRDPRAVHNVCDQFRPAAYGPSLVKI
jgi:hypothetical protein